MKKEYKEKWIGFLKFCLIGIIFLGLISFSLSSCCKRASMFFRLVTQFFMTCSIMWLCFFLLLRRVKKQKEKIGEKEQREIRKKTLKTILNFFDFKKNTNNIAPFIICVFLLLFLVIGIEGMNKITQNDPFKLFVWAGVMLFSFFIIYHFYEKIEGELLGWMFLLILPSILFRNYEVTKRFIEIIVPWGVFIFIFFHLFIKKIIKKEQSVGTKEAHTEK